MSSSPRTASPRRRRKHSSGRKNKSSSSRESMAVVEPASPSSPFSWRLERKSSTSKKSHGIPAARFHAKQEEGTIANENDGNSHEFSRQPQVPEWKEQIERSLLVQEQKAYMTDLETKRKGFRKITQLKTWPLQNMALEHLDHLLGTNAHCQFHGGDYLSAESSSSVSSVESSKPRLASQLTTKGNAPESSKITGERRKNSDDNDDNNENNSNKKTLTLQNKATQNNDLDSFDSDEDKTEQESSPLWSLEPRIFATEKGNGKRKYVVGEFGRVADWYWRKTAPTSRHLYELIREGSPCRLYFDLEFSKVHNPSVPSVQLLQELEDELAEELQTYFGNLLPQLQSSQIVNLDSSNETKFSRHWIVHLVSKGKGNTRSESRVEFLFKDAPTVGRFIKRMVGRLADEIGVEGGEFAKKRPALAKYLFVNTKDPNKQTCFIDLGVYTRNRLFRCFGSSKKGKTTILQVVLSESAEAEANPDESLCRHYFPLSLPSKKEVSSPTQSSTNILSMDDFVVANNWEPYAQALADGLVVPLKQALGKQNDNKSNFILEVEEGSYGSTSISALTDSSRISSERKYPPTIAMSRKGSPLPSLDRYVAEYLGSRGGVQGSIRAWSIEYGPRDTPVSFTYHIQKNRFCEIIGRSHKSNNIFWTIDLSSWTCIQGCFDPDCHGRGCPLAISNDGKHDGEGGTLDNIKQEFECWQEEEFEKALMALNIDDVVSAQRSSTEKLSAPRGKELDSENKEESADELSDDALLQAIMDNPELFP